MADLYDNERVNKIKDVMPAFLNVARSGDAVYMGLKGDPCFPKTWNDDAKRPYGTIASNNGEQVVIDLADGNRETYEAGMLNGAKLIEFTQDGLERVMNREREYR